MPSRRGGGQVGNRDRVRKARDRLPISPSLFPSPSSGKLYSTRLKLRMSKCRDSVGGTPRVRRFFHGCSGGKVNGRQNSLDAGWFLQDRDRDSFALSDLSLSIRQNDRRDTEQPVQSTNKARTFLGVGNIYIDNGQRRSLHPCERKSFIVRPDGP